MHSLQSFAKKGTSVVSLNVPDHLKNWQGEKKMPILHGYQHRK
jgi:hypothetical protein